LKNISIRFPLLHAIKDIPIYAKKIKELFNKNNGRKIQDPQTIQVVGKLDSLMTANVIA
jgi:hypothetical protein